MADTAVRELKPGAAKPPTAAHVLRAMNAVSAAISEDGIGKTRKNQQQGYSFRGIDEVLNVLSSLLAKQQLIIVPHIRSRELTERQNKSGGALFSVVVAADYTFVSAEDGSEHTVGPFYGEAMDSADKATNKAMSAAYKYMAIQTFCIPTEGDNDADATTHEVAARPAGEERPPSQPPPRQQPSIRSAAQPFIAAATKELEAAEGEIDAIEAAMDAIREKDGWKQLNEPERKAVENVKKLLLQGAWVAAQ